MDKIKKAIITLIIITFILILFIIMLKVSGTNNEQQQVNNFNNTNKIEEVRIYRNR